MSNPMLAYKILEQDKKKYGPTPSCCNVARGAAPKKTVFWGKCTKDP